MNATWKLASSSFSNSAGCSRYPTSWFGGGSEAITCAAAGETGKGTNEGRVRPQPLSGASEQVTRSRSPLSCPSLLFARRSTAQHSTTQRPLHLLELCVVVLHRVAAGRRGTALPRPNERESAVQERRGAERGGNDHVRIACPCLAGLSRQASFRAPYLRLGLLVGGRDLDRLGDELLRRVVLQRRHKVGLLRGALHMHMHMRMRRGSGGGGGGERASEG